MNIPSYFVIRHKLSKRMISGSDFRYSPPHSIYADEIKPPLLLTTLNLETEIQHRKINLKNYEVVSVTVNPYGTIKMDKVIVRNANMEGSCKTIIDNL